MEHRKFKQHHAGKGGWSEWVYPTSRYLFKCCDCGLVHDMEFRTFVEKDKKRGSFQVVSLPHPIRVMFRARRASKTSPIAERLLTLMQGHNFDIEFLDKLAPLINRLAPLSPKKPKVRKKHD